jgi:hypothetical protein
MRGNGIAALRAEISAFYAGFGDPGALRAAFRNAALLVPTTGDGRITGSEQDGVVWICAFTGPEEYARYLAARGTVGAEQEYPYHTLFGWRLTDHTALLDRPPGVAVDICGSAPMTFPPQLDAVGVHQGRAGTE